MSSDLTTVLVFCMAAMVLGHAVLLALALVSLDRRLRHWTERLTASQAAVGGSLRAASELLGRVAQIAAGLPRLEQKANHWIDVLAIQTERLDQQAARGLAEAIRLVEETGRRIEYGLVQFSRETTVLARKVRLPAKQLSAVLKGIQAGLHAWRRPPHPSALQDEEDFI
ncbi:MAG: hypothetical protein Kow001_17760 [Acidobacteriota bacterium]